MQVSDTTKETNKEMTYKHVASTYVVRKRGQRIRSSRGRHLLRCFGGGDSGGGGSGGGFASALR
jgi:hypothetical protein